MKRIGKSVLTILGCVFCLAACFFLKTIFNDRGKTDLAEDIVVDIESCNSPYTYVETRVDGNYDLYIFSSAVQWKDGKNFRKIDNSFISSQKDGFLYENASNNIKTYFPQCSHEFFLLESSGAKLSFKLTDVQSRGVLQNYTNLYGDEKEALCYDLGEGITLYIYAITKGFHIEYVFEDGVKVNELHKVQFQFPTRYMAYENSEYIFFKNDVEVIVYAPMVWLEESERLKYDSYWMINEEGNDFYLQPGGLQRIQHGKVHLSFSIQLHGEDIPDTTVYKNKEENVYLSDRAVVGKNDIVGEGWHYLRYRINYFFTLEEDSIIDAQYCFKSLNAREQMPVVSMYYPNDQWSSTQMFWKIKSEYVPLKQNMKCQYQSNGWVWNDLTSYVIQAVQDQTWMTESIGSVMICENGYTVVATSDNGEYIPYLRITLSQLPLEVYERDSVNDVN